jgi:hypothetical protein
MSTPVRPAASRGAGDVETGSCITNLSPTPNERDDPVSVAGPASNEGSMRWTGWIVSASLRHWWSWRGTGVKFGMRDARPALSIRGSLVRPKVWVQVDTSRESFVWRRDDHEHHAIDDPAGAAVRLAEYLKNRDAGPDKAS